MKTNRDPNINKPTMVIETANNEGKPYSNPRYVAYAKAHGKTPDEMMSCDKNKWQGGCMTGFIFWINQVTQEFHKQHPECFFDKTSISHLIDNDAFGKFIEKYSTKLIE